MFYEALYRRWRPKVFEDIIGQEQIVTILKNQIRYSNIAHAYLFTGMRGTGKTSTARIFARAVNCTNPEDANPCNNCEICKGILDESIMDVIEIDAASNRGIDNIRELREHTKYNPSVGKYRVYIIDEVHMLTKEASNALLKTLEEPPVHVIFILATTEPQGVAPTILSRCQRFDFRPVKIKDIVDRLSLICKEIPIDYEKEALHLIALNSGGAVRDALSILDRCISFNSEILGYDDVINMLGTVNYESIFGLAENIAKQNTPGVLTLINKMFAEGRDANQLMKDLILHFRSLLFAKLEVETDELLTLSEERLEQFKEQGKLFDINQISSFIYTLSDIEPKLKHSSQPRVLMEIAVASLCNKELDDSLEGIIKRVKQLEKIVASGGMVVSKNDGGKTNVGRDSNKVSAHGTDKIRDKTVHSDVQRQDTVRKQSEEKSMHMEHMKKKTDQKEKPGNNEESKDDEKLEYEKSKISKTSEYNEKPRGSKEPKDDGELKGSEKAKDEDRVLSTIKGVWEQVLNQTEKDGKVYIGALLRAGTGTLEKLREGILTISLKKGFEVHLNRLNKEETKEYISDIILKFAGQNIRPSFIIEKGSAISENSDKQEDPIKKLEETLPEKIFDIMDIVDG
ncbi:MAG TPA: DNA polymerase III subunit gamma/tau [Clostridia bacterium]|nr:DNA polymerase III subunit gamma/tau [Clostridia bacterium]